MSKAATMGRPLATTPDAPPDRVAALRKAFDATMKDPAFVAEAEKMQAEIDPMSGEDLARLVNDILAAGPQVRDSVLALISAPQAAGAK